MVTNFIEKTFELKKEEKEIILPMLLSGFVNKTKENAIKSAEIIRKMNGALNERGFKMKLCEVRFRKICNYIRSNGMLPLIADNSGYYLSTDKKDIELQIESLKDRAYAILNSAKGLEKFL